MRRSVGWLSRLMLAMILLQTVPVLGQDATEASAKIDYPLEVLPLVDPAVDRLSGTWKRTEDALVAMPPGRPTLLRLPVTLGDSYRVSLEFTRTDGNNCVGLILPLGDSQCALELSGWEGRAHGISRVDGRPIKDAGNPTALSPGTLQNDKRYRLVANVEQADDDVAIKVQLNEKALIDWTGRRSQLEPNLFIKTNVNDQLALVAIDSTVEFHRVTLHAGGKSLGTQSVPVAAGRVDLTKIAFRESSGTTRVASFRGEDVIEINGEEAVAFLPGIDFGDGVIECEIASATFSGIAFHGTDTKNYEVIYFRPFNSGTPKHENTVQYASKGVAGGEWDELRRESPGKYEAGADMKTNRWFRVKLVIEGESVKTYIGDGEEPVLAVEPMLGKRSSGKIGLWGWGSYFRNFRFTPAG